MYILNKSILILLEIKGYKDIFFNKYPQINWLAIF